MWETAFKGIVQSKMKILPLFTHPYVVPNLLAVVYEKQKVNF